MFILTLLLSIAVNAQSWSARDELVGSIPRLEAALGEPVFVKACSTRTDPRQLLSNRCDATTREGFECSINFVYEEYVVSRHIRIRCVDRPLLRVRKEARIKRLSSDVAAYAALAGIPLDQKYRKSASPNCYGRGSEVSEARLCCRGAKVDTSDVFIAWRGYICL